MSWTASKAAGQKSSRILLSIFAAAAGTVLADAQSTAREDALPDRINRMSDAERAQLTRSLLDHCLMDDSGAINMLAISRSSLVLPMIEQQTEEVLKSPSPLNCLTDKRVDTEGVILVLWATIANAGDQQALREASLLLKIDEKRFDRMVALTMSAAWANNRANPFTVAYQGFDLGDPAIDKRITAWAEEVLGKEVPYAGNRMFDDEVGAGSRRRWAAAMVERYRGVPTSNEWRDDPIASRLSPRVASAIHKDILRFSIEAVEKRK